MGKFSIEGDPAAPRIAGVAVGVQNGYPVVAVEPCEFRRWVAACAADDSNGTWRDLTVSVEGDMVVLDDGDVFDGECFALIDGRFELRGWVLDKVSE